MLDAVASRLVDWTRVVFGFANEETNRRGGWQASLHHLRSHDFASHEPSVMADCIGDGKVACLRRA